MTRESTITVNGHSLTEAEAMAVRVAVTDLHNDCGNINALGKDDRGKAITAMYRQASSHVLSYMGFPMPDVDKPYRDGPAPE